VRAVERYCGDVEPVDPVAGHIPGARNRWFKNNFNGDGTLKSPDRLRAEFAAEGLLADRIVSQCGSGVSAAAKYWALEHAGLHGSRVYGGSWSEWISDPARPVATGASSAAGRQRV
jgi:thiosulfate/3-mercaptopyruvate sulfurtransferase